MTPHLWLTEAIQTPLEGSISQIDVQDSTRETHKLCLHPIDLVLTFSFQIAIDLLGLDLTNATYRWSNKSPTALEDAKRLGCWIFRFTKYLNHSLMPIISPVLFLNHGSHFVGVEYQYIYIFLHTDPTILVK